MYNAVSKIDSNITNHFVNPKRKAFYMAYLPDELNSGLTYYQVLGVPENADLDSIKGAYRRLAMRYHPDVNSSPLASKKFLQIQQAYDTLSSIEKRQMYDWYRLHGNQVQTFRHTRYQDAANPYASANKAQYQPNRTPKPRKTQEELEAEEAAQQLDFLHSMTTLFLMVLFVMSFAGSTVGGSFMIVNLLGLDPYQISGLGFFIHISVIISMFVGYKLGLKLADKHEEKIKLIAQFTQTYYNKYLKERVKHLKERADEFYKNSPNDD